MDEQPPTAPLPSVPESEPPAPQPPAPLAPPPAPAPPPAAMPPAPPPMPPWQAAPEPAGPAPGLAFGGAGERLVAYIVDSLIIVGVTVVCFLLFFLIVPIFIGLVFGFVYFPYFWKKRGQTPGMRMFNLWVVRDRDGGAITWGEAILRFIGFWIDSIVFYLGFIWIFIDSRKRCWHDLIAGTVVVKRI
ncbi:MAG: RDD family protein [Candidatus Limnocylindrales bacterium]